MLVCNKLTVFYDKVKVLDDICFSINKGEVVGLVGKNGSGKSTIMKAICSLIKTRSGSVIVNGLDIKSHRIESLKCISAIIEGPSLYPNMTVENCIKMHSQLRDVEENVDMAYAYLQDITMKKKKVKNLSLGMKQQVALSLAFMTKPQLYILDEPVNGLDFDNVLRFRKKILDVKKDGASVLISSHILKELEMIVDRYIFIDNGKVVGSIINNKQDIETLYQEMIE